MSPRCAALVDAEIDLLLALAAIAAREGRAAEADRYRRSVCSLSRLNSL